MSHHELSIPTATPNRVWIVTRAVVKSVQHNPYIGTSTLELIDFRPPR